MEGEEKLKDAVSELLKNNSKKKDKSAIEKKTMERTKRKSVAKQSRITRRNIGAKTIGNERGKKEKEKCKSAETNNGWG